VEQVLKSLYSWYVDSLQNPLNVCFDRNGLMTRVTIYSGEGVFNVRRKLEN
jgi:hypothetical protein